MEKAKKTSGGYQPSKSVKPTSVPTTGSNAVKPRYQIGSECMNCGRLHSCPEAHMLESLSMNPKACGSFISEATHDAVFNKGKYSVHTYEEFADRFKGLSADQEWELIKLYDRYVEALKKDWSTRYTYCSGCFKDVRRDNTYTELTNDGKLLIRCKSCNTIWYVKDAE